MVRDQKEFEEHLDEVRELDNSEANQIEERIERLDRIAEQPDRNPLYAYPLPARIGLGVVTLIVSVGLGVVMYPNSLDLMVLTAIIPTFIVLMTLSKTNVALRREFVRIMQKAAEDASQQQQQNGASQSNVEKVVCQNCGWKNPESNNYCHDCGNEI